MKKLLSLVICCLLCVQFTFIVYAEILTADEAAANLYSLNLVKGAGTNKDGNINFELNREATRTEGIVMLIRLLGCENTALSSDYEHPFTDVPLWADKYIAYAYNKGLTKGISTTQFGSDDVINDKMYITFILRANGYSDVNNEDFSWDNPYRFAQELGISHSIENKNFLRSDMMILSYEALFVEGKDDKILYETLIEKKVFTHEEFNRICKTEIEVEPDKNEEVCNHNIATKPLVEASCTEVGYSEEEHCTICGKILKESKQLPKKEHTFDEWIVEEEATYTSEGTKVRKCIVCDFSERKSYKANIIEPESISIDNSLTIDKNDVVTIVPVLSPKNAYTKYTWVSSDNTIAKVNSAGNGTSGNVTGVSAGTTTITVYTENGLSASCTVTVKDTASTSSISINKNITLDKGSQKDLTIKLTPSNSKTLYSVKSSDESIVSVSTTGGRTGVRVRGVSAGEAEITVYTDDGLSATCIVTVNGAPDPTNITIPSTYTMNGGDTWDIPISIEPRGISTAYSITSSDSTIAKVGTTGGKTGCRVQAYSPGTATVTVYTENGLSASCEITVK